MAEVMESTYTPVEYDEQYILMVNGLKKHFPIKGGMLSKTVGWVKAVDGVTILFTNKSLKTKLIHISNRSTCRNANRCWPP